MIIGSRQRMEHFIHNPQITIGNHLIKKVSVLYNRRAVKVKEHNDAQCKKILLDRIKSIALLRRAKSFATTDGLIIMFNALVLPHFTYCSNVWNDGNVAHIEKQITKKDR